MLVYMDIASIRFILTQYTNDDLSRYIMCDYARLVMVDIDAFCMTYNQIRNRIPMMKTDTPSNYDHIYTYLTREQYLAYIRWFTNNTEGCIRWLQALPRTSTFHIYKRRKQGFWCMEESNLFRLNKTTHKYDIVDEHYRVEQLSSKYDMTMDQLESYLFIFKLLESRTNVYLDIIYHTQLHRAYNIIKNRNKRSIVVFIPKNDWSSLDWSDLS
jgi:hypothetical protein